MFWKYDLKLGVLCYDIYCPKHKLKLHQDDLFPFGDRYYCQVKNHKTWTFRKHYLDRLRKEVENILEKKFDYNPNSEFET